MENTEIVYGKNPVETLLESNSQRVNKIYIVKGIKYDEKIRNIVNLAKKYKIALQDVPKEKMNAITDGVHQGVAASVSPVNYTELKTLIKSIENKDNKTVIILDRVEDPHNLGSIIRTAVAAGVDGIILPKRRSSQVTSVVYKSSAGTADMLPIVLVSNLNNAIDDLKKAGFWIVGAEADAKKNYFEEEYNFNCALVLGGENQGISNLVKKNCDILIKIPMLRKINSLNVANSASILIYELVRQRISKKTT